MSVKRISGGGGQGGRPGREVKGHTFFGQTFVSQDPSDRLMLEEIDRARVALAAIRKSVSRQPVSRIGSEIAQWQLARVDELAGILGDARHSLSRRFEAALEVKEWGSARKRERRPTRKRSTRVAHIPPKKGGRLGGFSAPDSTAGGVRQRLYRLLDIGPEKFGIQTAELEADLAQLPTGKAGKKNDDPVTISVRKKYMHLFAKLKR